MIAERRLYFGTLVVLVAVTGVVVGLPGGGGTSVPQPDASEGTSYNVTDAGVRYTVHPDRLQQGCPGGMDCIPSIENPRFQSPAEADWLDPNDRVIGVTVDGEARAYPLRVLTVHEIVNDRIAGRPVAVTYCPLCRSGLVFDRRVRNRTLTFGVSGKLLDANLVMYDRQTETYWSQVEGEAIVGEQVPTRLEIVPSSITTWREWREAHPETRVLSRQTGVFPTETYGSNPYGGYANSSRVGFGVENVDPRLQSKAIVYGVTGNGTERAYPEPLVKERDVINDEVGGVPVLVVEDQDDGGVRAFLRRVDGETRTFSLSDGQLVDDTGTRWRFDGEAVSGPDEGARLEPIETHGFYWFAWSQFNPDTEIYGRNGTA